MWQVLVAAAVAGSTGLVAKHIFGCNLNPKSSSLDETPEDQELPDGIVDSEVEVEVDSKFDSPIVSKNAFECDEIFRFSSSGSGSGSRFVSRNLRKKVRSRCRAAAKEAVGSCGGELVMEKQKKSCGRFHVCLKKRKTSKSIGAANSGSCSSKDGSLFHWGLGVGIMCMMSAGKTEINKLNATVDETSKVVQELKSELYKRKSSHHMQAVRACENSEISGCDTIEHEIDGSSSEHRRSSEMKKSTLSMLDDAECESSVLTEEPEPEIHEMDQLEKELATELKKLPWCTTEQSYQAGVVTNLDKTKVSAIELHGPQNQSSRDYQLHGVPPAELDQKLCHLLIEQQENQIVELESELQVSQSKLQEKEAELQALKDCVRRLTQFSLSTVSDDEAEAHSEKKLMECEPMRSVVGMKRPIESDFWNYV